LLVLFLVGLKPAIRLSFLVRQVTMAEIQKWTVTEVSCSFVFKPAWKHLAYVLIKGIKTAVH
jgi:hypothetical protein